MPWLKKLPNGKAVLMVGDNKPVTKVLDLKTAQIKLAYLNKDKEKILAARRARASSQRQQSNENDRCHEVWVFDKFILQGMDENGSPRAFYIRRS